MFETLHLLQCNLGHARRAQDLLCQTIRESRIALAVVAEPYRVPGAPNWAQDTSGREAITWSPVLGAHGALLYRGNGYVAIEWAGIVIVGIYVSPNSGLAAFGDYLDKVGACVRRCHPRQVLVLGDFNVHSAMWGNGRATARGRWLTDWAAGLGLLLANSGTVKTCVAWRGRRSLTSPGPPQNCIRRFKTSEWRREPRRYLTTSMCAWSCP
jgi:hypothetical protein